MGRRMSLALLKRRTQNSDVPKELNLALTHLSKFSPRELDLLPRAANRLPDISPARMGLFGISTELQFGICKHGKLHTSCNMLRKEPKIKCIK